MILHLGLSKTGTSAIQSFCSKNHKQLKKKGILYPFPDKDQALGYMKNGNLNIINLCRNNPSEALGKEDLNTFFSKLESKLTPQISCVILSSENLWGLTETQWRFFYKRAS